VKESGNFGNFERISANSEADENNDRYKY